MRVPAIVGLLTVGLSAQSSVGKVNAWSVLGSIYYLRTLPVRHPFAAVVDMMINLHSVLHFVNEQYGHENSCSFLCIVGLPPALRAAAHSPGL